MNKFSILITFAALVLCDAAVASAGPPQSVRHKYLLTLKGEKVGETLVTRSFSKAFAKGTIDVETATNITVKSFWGDWVLAEKSLTVQTSKEILDFNHKIVQGKNKWHVSGKQFNQALWCSARKVLTPEELEVQDMTDLAGYIVARVVPHAGTAFLVVDLLDGQEDDPGDVSIPLDRFDTTTSTLPAALLALAPKEQVHWRILDTCELKIRTALVSAQGTHQLFLAGKPFACRVFEVKTKEGLSTCWISRDCFGAFMVQEKGKDADGPFDFTLNDVLENR